ncbi:MAG: nitrous oxide-stimulated promoter family protein [Coriobacteriia bacterium]|nr:nitrous oxide-stimulated promoter family protein [Coriobacteriia bacterium]
MNETFARKMADPAARKDTRLLGDFSAIYCRGVHRSSVRTGLVSDGADLGVYGSKPPAVCDECAELLRYAEKRRAYCPKDPKPFCSYCDTHCYRADMREQMRAVMRYAGPRSIFHGHAIDGIRHVIEGRRAKRKFESRSAATTDREESAS